MSTIWMPLCGQTWLACAASFVGGWTVMMAAMMSPSLTLALWRYRDSVLATSGGQAAWPTLLAGTGYFLAWAGVGAIAFAGGAVLAASELRSITLAHMVPLSSGIVVLIAGAIQFTPWKTHRIEPCGHAPQRRFMPAFKTSEAWEHGLRLAYRDGCCCANLMVVLLVVGVMDLPAMAAATVAMHAERLLLPGTRAIRAVGFAIIAVGLGMIAKALCFAGNIL